MVGQSATREREQYQGPPPAREADFKEQAEDIEETIQAAEQEGRMNCWIRQKVRISGGGVNIHCLTPAAVE